MRYFEVWWEKLPETGVDVNTIKYYIKEAPLNIVVGFCEFTKYTL